MMNGIALQGFITVGHIFEPGDGVIAAALGEDRFAALLAEGRIALAEPEAVEPAEPGQTEEGQIGEDQAQPGPAEEISGETAPRGRRSAT